MNSSRVVDRVATSCERSFIGTGDNEDSAVLLIRGGVDSMRFREDWAVVSERKKKLL